MPAVADIAREANTTTSLLSFYFESKDDLVLATLRSIASDLDSQAAEVTTPSEVAVAVSRSLIERPAFARTLSWLVLERRSIPQEMGDNPFLRRLRTTLATDETEDPHTLAGAVISCSSPNPSSPKASMWRSGEKVTMSDSPKCSVGSSPRWCVLSLETTETAA